MGAEDEKGKPCSHRASEGGGQASRGGQRAEIRREGGDPSGGRTNGTSTQRGYDCWCGSCDVLVKAGRSHYNPL